MRNGSSSNNQYPRHMSTGSLNIPNGQSGPTNGGSARADGIARSPPTRQNTGHVPCKFFRQGTCQAGQACPFSHDLASTTDNICKYFSKGNCKFGPKCANIHVLPDGRRINYKGNMAPMTPGHLNLGGRINPDPYHGQGSALTNSFARAQGVPPSPYSQTYGNFTTQEDGFVPMGRQGIDINIPTIDTSYASHPGSNYGSPRDDMMDRFSLGLSPVAGKGLSVLDAPLPASFDSNGVSWIARHGPVAASVPTKFGIDSPPSSVGAAKTSDALRNLHSSAFGDDTRDRFNGIASSPPSEEYYGKRTMHSHRLAKTKIMSASLPKEQDWAEAFAFEEDLLPEALNHLMTPAEKARRGSRAAYEESKPSRGFYDEARSYSGTGTPSNDTPIKFGSPSNASPSRWGAYFTQKHKEEDDKISRASAFGHVGSPLRNSLLHEVVSPSSRPIARPNTSGDASPYLASPPRQTSMSIISQQLQRTRLARAEANDTEPSLLSSSAARTITTPIGSGRSAFADRQASSSSGRFTTPIDEEQGDFVFNMEGMDDDEKSQKRSSGPWTIVGNNKSSNLGAVGGGRNIPANKTISKWP
ncbi:hypothetical protein NHQ30_007802 [Ciborinia camelliae]|nr:hypothetical protein NHQ30_007802 [Ciborinia camelliae]